MARIYGRGKFVAVEFLYNCKTPSYGVIWSDRLQLSEDDGLIPLDEPILAQMDEENPMFSEETSETHYTDEERKLFYVSVIATLGKLQK